jgi:hypothetical protein
MAKPQLTHRQESYVEGATTLELQSIDIWTEKSASSQIIQNEELWIIFVHVSPAEDKC